MSTTIVGESYGTYDLQGRFGSTWWLLVAGCWWRQAIQERICCGDWGLQVISGHVSHRV